MSVEVIQEWGDKRNISTTPQPAPLGITQERVWLLIQEFHPIEYSTFSGAFRFLRKIDPRLIDRLGWEDVILKVFSEWTDEIPIWEFRRFAFRWYKFYNKESPLAPPSESKLLGHIREEMNPDSWIRLPDSIANGHFMIFCNRYTDIKVVPLAKLPLTLCDHEITQSDLYYQVLGGTKIDYILSHIISPIFAAYPQIKRIFLQINWRWYIVPRDMLTEGRQLADFVVA